MSGSRWPDATSTGSRTGCGCCAGTASSPRAPSGRRSTRLLTTSCPTWSPSSTSTGSASAAPPTSAGTRPPTPSGPWPSAPARSKSTGTTSASSTTRFAEAAGHVAGDKPTVIIAKTIKGKGFSEVENSPDWHGKPFPPDMADRAIAELGGVRNLVIRGPRPEPAEPGPALEHPSTLAPQDQNAAAEQGVAGLQGRREGGHQEGLRGRARRPRRPGPQGGRARRRGQQLHVRRGVHARVPRAVLRDVHRRAADGRRRDRARRPRLQDVRLDLRRVPHPGLRLHPDGRHLAASTCGSSARTRASRSARTARPRWRWKTWP